jgi:uncharacterized protein (UPF0210 family)
MKIRALTGFIDPGWPMDTHRITPVADCLKATRERLAEAHYEVQTLRLATPPPAEMTSPISIEQRPDFASQLEAVCFVQGIDYAALGPVLPGDLEGFEAIPKLLSATDSIFTSALFADAESGLSLATARACSEVIQEIATITPDGFANLRFAALANVPCGSPFFPAAYHRGGPPAMAIATEAADLAISAFQDQSSPASACRLFIEAVEGHASVLSRITQPVAAKHDIRFWGIDFSLAPYPEEARSLGAALRACGIPVTGFPGTVTAAAFLANCLDRAQFQRTGFCGLFFPVLEDSILAEQAANGHLTVTDLLLYSTVCGTGLDTIPLPGDIGAQTLYALLLDLGSLALRHDKPLTARLMPIPGKKAGDEIRFDFEYFAPSRVMAVNSQIFGGVLSGSSSLDIGPHSHSKSTF